MFCGLFAEWCTFYALTIATVATKLRQLLLQRLQWQSQRWWSQVKRRATCVFINAGESRGHWVRWDTLVPESRGSISQSPVSTVALVPTTATVKTQYLVDILGRHGNHVLLLGDRGSAKSLVVRHYLSQKHVVDSHLSKTVVLSSAATSASMQVHSHIFRPSCVKIFIRPRL